uniref:Uncharacterized protein n=1 Tax=Arundo donax TaxID=35708 RepID=A0A0A9BX78_ARUDO
MDLPLVIQLTNHTFVQANKDTHQIAQYLASIGFSAHNAILSVREDLSDHSVAYLKADDTAQS